jgi:hypothetical protein
VLLVLVAMLALVGACAPSLASSFVPGIAAEQFAQRFAGTLRVGEASLGWFGHQRIEQAELFDPSGARVASLDVDLPGLLELLRGGGKRARGVDVAIDAELVADDAGVTNLQRALAPRSTAPASGTPGPGTGGGSSPWPNDLDVAAAIRVRRASWSDARTRAGGGPVLCENGEISLHAAPGKPLELRVSLPLGGSANGKVLGTASVRPAADGVPIVDASFDVQKLPTALVDALLGHGADGKPRLAPVLGGELDATVEFELPDGAAPLDAAISLRGAALAKPISVGAQVTELRPWLAGLARAQSGAPLALPPKLDAVAKVADVPTALLEAFAGPGSLRALIGDELDLDFDATVERASPGEPLAARGKLRAGPTAPLSADFDVKLRELGPNDPSIAGVLPLRSLDARLTAQGVASIASRLAPPGAAPWLSLVGDSMQLDVRLDATHGEPTPVSVALSSGVTRFSLQGEMHATRLVLPGDGLELAIADLPQAVRDELARFVPPGTRVEPLGGLTVRGRDLDLPIGGASLDPLAVLPLSSGDVALELGTLRYVDPSLTAAKQGLELSSTRATLALRAGQPLTVGISALLNGASDGRLEASVRLPEPAALARLSTDGLPAVDASFDLQKLPTALVDALLGHGADGKPRLTPVLGPELDAKLAARLGGDTAAAPGTLDVDVSLNGVAFAKPIALRAKVGELGEWLAGLSKSSAGAQIALPPKLTATVALADVPTALLESFAGPESLRALIGDELDLDFDATLERASADAPLTARGKLRAGPTAPLSAEFDVALRELGPNQPSIAGVLPLRSLDARVTATGAASIASRLAPPAAAPWLTLVGDSMQLAAKVDATHDEPAPISITLSSGVTRLALNGELRATRLVLPGDGLELAIADLPQAVRDELARFVPPGTRVEPLGGLTVRGRDLDLPIGGSSLDPLAVLPLASGDVALELGTLRYVDPSLAAAKQRLELSSTRATLALRGGQPLTVGISALLGGASDGRLEASVRLPDPAALARLSTDGLPAVDADAKVVGLSTAALDAWTGRAGLVQDLLGERLDLELSARGASAKGGTLTAKLTSPLASATLSGNLAEGLVFAPDDQRTELAFALTPLSSKRVVGSLVPMFVQVASADPSSRAALTLSKFKLPLDGDLSKLDGTIALDLGNVDFGFLPGIAELFGPALSKKGQRLGPYSLSIQGGVVSYQRLSIDIGGKPIAFSGSCNLAKSEFALEVGIPLAYAGKSVAAQLDKYKQFLSQDLEIPLTIKGAWTKPKIGIQDGFIEKLAEDALKGALKGGLLDGLLGGKKK